MIYLYVYLAMIAGAFCTLIALTAMRRRERHNVGKLGWLLLILLTPPVGLLLFVIFSGKTISAEHDTRETVKLPSPDEADAIVESSLARIAVARGLPSPSRNNCMEVLVTPESMHEALFRLIDSAETRLFIHTFILIDDAVGNEIIDRLCEKSRSGVEVRLMIDGFGSFVFSDNLLKKVDDAGGRTTRFKPVRKFSRLAYMNFRNHRKLVVADAQRAMIGGANWVEYQMTQTPDDNTWVDYSLRIDGLAARQIEAVFLSDWNFATGDQLQPSDAASESIDESEENRSTLQVIPVGPDGPAEILHDLWLTAINRAQDRVWIITPYFVPPPMAMRSLAMAVRRGVDVQIIYPDDSDMPPADYARRDYVQELQELGARILRLPNRMVHAKILLVDREVAYGGSANFDMRSFFLNYELVVGVFNQSAIDEITRWFEKLADRCSEGPKEDNWNRRLMAAITRMFGEEL